ncbi:MAG: hypothetical protein IPQ24_18990 [Anaeromyxobacter sp.]|nr:hypothetical protein [Anaeromyxobacter sp.]
MAEELVPAGAQGGEVSELEVEVLGREAEGAEGRGADRLDGGEEVPAVELLLEDGLEVGAPSGDGLGEGGRAARPGAVGPGRQVSGAGPFGIGPVGRRVPGLDAAGRHLVVGVVGRVLAEVLLGDGLEPLPGGGGGAEQAAGQGAGPVERVGRLGREREDQPLPGLVVVEPG